MKSLGWRVLQPILFVLLAIFSFFINILYAVVVAVTFIHDRIRYGK